MVVFMANTSVLTLLFNVLQCSCMMGILVCSSAKVVKKGEELTFDDNEDDLIDALGFDNDKEVPKKEAVPQKTR